MFSQQLELARANLQSDSTVTFNKDHSISCSICDTVMKLIFTDTYECPICEQQYNHQDSIAENTGTDELQIRDASGRLRRTRSRNSDYRKQQIQTNKARLMTANDLWAEATGNQKLPEEVLDEAAKLYSSLQIAYYNIRRVKFVRRGNIKDQILACLVHKILKKKGMPRQRAEIASIFKLDITGFSTGETQIQELENVLNLDLVYDPSDEIVDLATRYLKSLDSKVSKTLYTTRNLQFIVDLVIRAEVIKCGICCYLYSRVAGAVFLFATELNLKLHNRVIESSCDKCKKNTFERFKKIIGINYPFFVDIFTDFKKSRTPLDSLNTSKLRHLKVYINKLVEMYGYPEFIEIKNKLDDPESNLADDYDPFVDAILKKYNYPVIKGNLY